jgi:fructan beta-fructosidase
MKNLTILFCLLIHQFVLSQADSYYSEIYRPQFHFTPEKNWMNDPNGMVYFNGKYHLFYQYFPDGVVWGPMHWGHAESVDLLHWKHLPIALYPDKLGWIFSGSAIVDKENTAGFGKNALIAIFTYHNDAIWKSGKKNTESQALAYSLDEGKTWLKYKGNPVLNNSGEQDFRDPKVFWNESSARWNMVLAAGDKIKIFSSMNLKKWQFESDFKPLDDDKDLGVWECPDLLPMKVENSNEIKWLMIVNHGDKAPNGGSGTRYFIGDFDGKTFNATQKAIWMDGGTDFYAAVTYSNTPNDKKILLGWMSNWQYATKVPTEVWRSAMTLPRELQLVKEKNTYLVTQKIIPEFSSLKKTVFELNEVATPFVNKSVDLSQTEITFNAGDARDIIISISNSKGEIFNVIVSDNKLVTDRSNSGLKDFNPTFTAKPQVMSLNDKKIDSFQLIIDKSSIEILLNDGQFSMTNLIFPTENYSTLTIISKEDKPIRDLKINSISRVWK